ncbi:hypothetical protein CUN63_30580 [Pseudomonas sp. ACM7]|nr:hypothetical protein CUN63_30580 [Pseudomonas sp. ACM7]
MLLSKEVAACIGRGWCAVFQYTQNQCGSELARDEGSTFNIDVDCQTAIASKLAPTGSSVCLRG